MRYAGILLTLAVIGIMAVWMFNRFFDTGGGKTADWFYAHDEERRQQLAWCNEHPQQQDSADCTKALAAQMRFDSEPH